MTEGFSAEAIVLGATDVGEEDRILTFLTREKGVLKAAATSARNLKKGKAAPLDLFVRTHITLHIPRRPEGLKRISSAKVVDPFLGLRSDYRRLCAASYMAQTTSYALGEDDPSPQVYDLLLFCLQRLDQAVQPFEVLLVFEVRFLDGIGIMPQFLTCLKCGQEVGAEGCLDLENGGVLHVSCSPSGPGEPLTGGDLAVLRHIAYRPLPAVGRLSVKEDTARRLFRRLHPFTVQYLGHESKSLSMLEKQADH